MENVLPKFMLMDRKEIATYDKYLAAGITKLTIDELLFSLQKSVKYLQEHQKSADSINSNVDEKYIITPAKRNEIIMEYQKECRRRAMSMTTSEEELEKLQKVKCLH